MNRPRNAGLHHLLCAIGLVVAVNLAAPPVARADHRRVRVIRVKPHRPHHGPKARIIVGHDHHVKVREYFVVHRAQLPRYYYEVQPLPPGLQRHLVVTGHLPPGLEKRYIHPFPPALEVIIGPPPPGTRRVIIGHNAYLVEDRTGLILDILANIF